MSLPLHAITMYLAGGLLLGVCALAWLLVGLLLRQMPAVALRIAGADALLSLSVLLIARRGQAGLDGLSVHGVGLTTALGYLLLSNALHRMLARPPTWRWHAALLAAMLAASLLKPLHADALAVVTVATTAVAGLLLLQMWRDIICGLRGEFTPWAARLLATPFALGGLVYLSRMLALTHGLATDPQFLVPRLSTPAAIFFIMFFVLCINACMVGITIGRLVQRIHKLAQHDGLTGVWNRRAMDARLAAERGRLQRGRQPFALLMVDLDHFKRVNDSLGHAGGDAALKHAVARFSTGLRAIDALGRYGGEEFMVLLPMTGLDGAAQAAERMRTALAAQPLHWEGQAVTLTASFGVAAATDPDEPDDALLRRADGALYRAKAGGRNAVALADA